MHLDDLLGHQQARRLREVLERQLREAYDENCGRFRDDLGDNNVTFGVSVLHNLRHLVEEALANEAGFETERPRGSFEITVDGHVSLHIYKARRGPNGLEMIRFDDSQTKADLVKKNVHPDQLTLTLHDDAPLSLPPGSVKELVVLHVGDRFDGLEMAYIGAPAHSRVNGLCWLWLETLDGSEEVEAGVAGPLRVVAAEALFGDGKLPELEVELLEDALDERRGEQAG